MADENTAGSRDPNEPEPSSNEPGEPADPSASGAADPAASAAADPSAAGAPAAAAKPVATTPGQRLAAKQAQKAAQKREFKEELKRNEEEARRKELEEADRIMGKGPVEAALPANVEKAASTFTSFLQRNRERIVLGVIAAVVMGGAGLGLSRFLSAGSREQAAALAQAIELANAPIDADDADGKTDDGKPLFKSVDERAAKSATSFAEAVKVDPESRTGAWAKLGQAAAQLALDKPEEARASFQSAAGAESSVVRARALEGAAIALETQGKTDEALKSFEKLKEVEGQKELAEYHIARLKLAQGDRDTAKDMLKSLYDQLNAPKEDSPPSTYLKTEVELRLAELDPSLVDQGSSAQPPQQFSEEQLQRLLEQLQKGKAPGAQGE